MSANREVAYSLDFRAGRRVRPGSKTPSPGRKGNDDVADHSNAAGAIPRIARLMALAIRFDELLRAGRVKDYAQLARLGHVTRARMTQIMRLLDLAPDLQERLLLMTVARGTNERNLRPVVKAIDWSEQRRLFQKLSTDSE
jgi:hypothetical protein